MNYLPSISVQSRVTDTQSFDDPRSKLQVSELKETDDFFRKTLLKSAVVRRAASLPFRPIWNFGMDIISKMINLTSQKNEWKICYSVNQLGVIYDQYRDNIEFLMGHQNFITSMAINQTGEWLVTADNGKDSTIIVWDVEKCFPVCSIFDPHPEVGVAEVGISQDAKYIVSVGAESESVIKFWMWTLGNEEADATYITKQYGLVKNIVFNPHNTTMFAVTFVCAVLFCTWKEGKKKIVVKEGRIPRTYARDYGDYSQSLYGPHTHDCYTVTTNGWVLVWGRNFHKVPFKSVSVTNNKIFIKAIKIEECGITSISYIDGYIQTTDCKGQIRFYNKEFKIMYYFKKHIPPALQVSFNLKPRKYIIKDYKKREDSITSEENENEEDSTETVLYVNSSFSTHSSMRESEKKTETKVIIKDSVEIISDPNSKLDTTKKSEQKTKWNASIYKESVTSVIRDPKPSLRSNSSARKSIVTINENAAIMDSNSPFVSNSTRKSDENSKPNSLSKERVTVVMDPKSSFNTISKSEGNDSTDEMYMNIRRRTEKKSVTSLDEHYIYRKSNDDDDYNNDKENIPDGDIEIYETYEVYLAKQLSADFTSDKAPFIVRDCIILTMSGNLVHVDMANDKIDYVLEMKYSPINAIEVNPEKDILIIAYEDNWIYGYDYNSGELLTKIYLPQYIDDFKGKISCIRYSYKGYFLVIGTTKGIVYFLDPVTTEPLTNMSYTYTASKIIDIIFSSDNNYIAYRDAEQTVLLLKLSNSKSKIHWKCHGRMKAHIDDITGMLFCRLNRLFTIGKDRCIVEYNVKCSKPNYLDIILRIEVLQRGYPTAFTTYELVYEEDNIFFLITTNDHKHIIFSEHQPTVERKLSAPTLNLNEFVTQLQIVPDGENNYLVYRCGKHLGLQSLPISGNPFSYISVIAHSSEVVTFRFGGNGRYVFTYGVDDTVCVMWEIKTNSVDYQSMLTDKDMNPYLDLLEGGRDGPLLKEIMDVFYFMQIVHQGDDSPHKRNVADKIAVIELPNFLRAVGYFPSEQELDNIMYEASSYYLHKPMIMTEYYQQKYIEEECISFDNCIKLYLNHRPANGFTKRDIEKAFRVLEGNGPLTRVKFIELLCSKGEAFSPLTLHNCFSTLTLIEEKNVETRSKSWKSLFQEYLPDVITWEYFLDQFLGLMEKSE